MAWKNLCPDIPCQSCGNRKTLEVVNRDDREVECNDCGQREFIGRMAWAKHFTKKHKPRPRLAW